MDKPMAFGPEFGTESATLTIPEDHVKGLAAVMAAAETATLNEKLEKLEAENATLKTANEDLTTKLEVAETAKATAEKALNDREAELARETELAGLRAKRADEVKALAPNLLEGEEAAVKSRVQRWSEMEEAAFASYLEDLKSVTSQGAGSAGNTVAETATITARTSATGGSGTNPAAVIAKGI